MEVLTKENLVRTKLVPLQFPERSILESGESGFLSKDFSF